MTQKGPKRGRRSALGGKQCLPTQVRFADNRDSGSDGEGPGSNETQVEAFRRVEGAAGVSGGVQVAYQAGKGAPVTDGCASVRGIRGE